VVACLSVVSAAPRARRGAARHACPVAGSGRLPSVWIWGPHVAAVSAVVLVGVAYVAVVRIFGGPEGGPGGPRRRHAAFAAALVLSAVFLTWPVADLAQRSLLVRMAQQTILLLAVPPLALLGLPRRLVDAMTRPAVLDWAARSLTRPAVATVLFNIGVLVVYLPPVMNTTVRSWPARAGVDLTLLLAGVIMWVPALRVLPGTGQLRPTGRAGYLMIQSVIPSFASLVFIFARHPLYSAFDPSSIGITTLVDQQLAGALAKVASLAVLIGAAATLLWRSHQIEERGGDPDPLTWDDVERELRRLERRQRPTDSTT